MYKAKDFRGQFGKAGLSARAAPKLDRSREGATQQRVRSQSVQREQDRFRRVREEGSRAAGQNGQTYHEEGMHGVPVKRKGVRQNSADSILMFSC